MFKISLLLVSAAISVSYAKHPCAYWCEAPCTPKVTSFYCCSYEPSLVGPAEFLPPPCTNLCSNRTGNELPHLRNCMIENQKLKEAGIFRICTNFKDCDPSAHDLCCPDNCLPSNRKMCIKL